jgi:hypothetical protein
MLVRLCEPVCLAQQQAGFEASRKTTDTMQLSNEKMDEKKNVTQPIPLPETP